MAVANTAQINIPRYNSHRHSNRAGCQRIAVATPATTHAIAAHAATCTRLSAVAECCLVYSPTKMMCTAYSPAATNVSTSPRFRWAMPSAGIVKKYNPKTATIAPAYAPRASLLPQNIARRRGTSTTLEPVTKPDLEGVVYCKPAV